MEPDPQRLFDPREFPVLYVDDELENLRIFELGFRRDFTIWTAPSGEAGLEILNERPVAVILSDHRMPGMSGVEFLTRARELDPKTVRILVTAYGDAETLGSAINDGCIHRYVAKPWDPGELRLAVRRAIELYALERERVALVRELTAVNQIAQTINRELSVERFAAVLMEALTSQLEYDGAMLLLWDPRREGFRLERVAPSGAATDALMGTWIPAHEAPRFARLLGDGEMVHLRIDELAGIEAPVRRWLGELGADEVLLAPLMSKQAVLGAVAVDNRRGGSRFGASDHTLLEGIATQAAIALCNARLVEDLRRSREQVLRADRLGTLGTLAAGLAHEINNPLVSIHTFLSLAVQKRHEDDPEFWGDYQRLACHEMERIRGLVATMARLGRHQGEVASRETCDLGTLAREVTTLVAREARAAEVELEVCEEDDVPKVAVARDQIHQLLLNLTLNALQASPGGGRVVLRLEPEAEGGVALSVEDEGPGIPEEHLERIFDPFFTTKGPDQGTGLGLMICHRIAADHGGTIEVTSRPGEGAIFRLRLPPEGRSPAEDGFGREGTGLSF